jgi:hypothetical protein
MRRPEILGEKPVKMPGSTWTGLGLNTGLRRISRNSMQKNFKIYVLTEKKFWLNFEE